MNLKTAIDRVRDGAGSAVEWVSDFFTVNRRYEALRREHSKLQRYVHEIEEDNAALQADYLDIQERIRAQQLKLEQSNAAVSAPATDAPPALTQEQTARVGQLVEQLSMSSRFAACVLISGFDAQAPFGSLTNRVALERSIGYLFHAIRQLRAAGDIRGKEVSVWKDRRDADARKPGAEEPR
jgi:septal ring factor EnvC (AmiA/AmiB activator)